MQFDVEGANRTTGDEMRIIVEAPNREEALKLAQQQGILVSTLYEHSDASLASIPHKSDVSRKRWSTLLLVGILAIILVCFTAMVTYCLTSNRQQNIEPSKPPDRADPVTSFKAFSARFVPQLGIAYARHGGFDYIAHNQCNRPYKIAVDKEYSVDVEKTNSLVSPYIGVLTLRESRNWVPTDELPANSNLVQETLHFALQDSNWNLTDAEEGNPGDSYTWNGMDEPNRPECLRQAVLAAGPSQ